MADNRERQLAELLLLESMYPDDFEWQSPTKEAPSLTDFNQTDPCAVLKIQAFTLEISLPPDYPDEASPHVYLHCDPEVPTATRKEARQVLADTVATLDKGIEVLDLLVTNLTDPLAAGALSTSLKEPSTEQAAKDTTQSQNKSPSTLIRRLLFWSHHLLATSKRRDIVAWSRELSLGGFSKPGYPGAILVEGDPINVAEFETRIKALRWQALQVRGEDDGDRRLLSDGTAGVQEVEELSDIVKTLRNVDNSLADWFLVGMKIGHG